MCYSAENNNELGKFEESYLTSLVNYTAIELVEYMFSLISVVIGHIIWPMSVSLSVCTLGTLLSCFLLSSNNQIVPKPEEWTKRE